MATRRAAGARRLTVVLAVLALAVVGGLLGWLTDRSSHDAPRDETVRVDGTAGDVALPRVGDAADVEAMGATADPAGGDATASEVSASPPWPGDVVEVHVTGRVVDARGRPFAGATVALHPDRRTARHLEALAVHAAAPTAQGPADPLGKLPRVLTGPDGRFAVRGPWRPAPAHLRGAHTDPVVVAAAPDLAWHGFPVRGFDGAPVDVGDLVLVHPGARLVLRVVDEAARPLPDVSVRSYSYGYQTPADDDPVAPHTLTGLDGSTGPDGRVAFRHLWPGRFHVAVEARDRPVKHVEVEVEAGRLTVAPDIVLAKGEAVAGVVVDVAGTPVVGADVAAVSMGWVGARFRDWPAQLDAGGMFLELLERADRRARTDAEGRFRIAGLAGWDAAALIVRSAAHRSRLVAGVPLGEEEVAVTLAPASRLRVDARGADDRPLADATVDARVSVDVPEDSPSADGFDLPVDGTTVSAEVSLPITLRVRASGLAPTVVEVPALEAGEMRDLVVRLATGGVVDGRVVDDLGAPVADAQVVAVPEDERDAAPWADGRQLTSDASGRFRLDGLTWGDWDLEVDADGHASGDARVVVRPSAAEVAVTVALERRARVTGVVRRASGAPAVGQRVFARKIVEARHGSRLSSTTDREGRFVVANVSPGRWRVTAEPGGETEVEVAAGDVVEVALRLDAPQHVAGRVTRGGLPFPLVRVEARRLTVDGEVDRNVGPSTRTVGDGTYALELPGPGAWWLSFAPRDGPRRTERLVVATGDSPVVDVEFGTGRIAGRVAVGADGAPPREAPLVWLASGDEHHGSVRLDERGGFAFEPLRAGTYVVSGGNALVAPFASDPVTLAEGERVEGLVLVTELAALVEGHVLHADGTPFVGFVHLRRTDGEPEYRVEEIDTDDGLYLSEGLPPGRWRLDLASFPEAELGVPVRGEPGAELPRLGGATFDLAPGEARELDVLAEGGPPP